MDATLDINKTGFVDKRGHKPRERRCVASGEVKNPEFMIRFVLSPDHIVTPDITGKLPGRGVYVTADKDSLAKAIKTNAFARGFKTKAAAPEDLAERVENGLRRQLLSLIAMTKKSGQLILGFDQVQSAARSEALAWRIEAIDGSEDGRGKIRTLSKAVARELEAPLPQVIGCFNSEELGQITGRDKLIHAAIVRGKMSGSLKLTAKRLSGFCALIPKDWPDYAHEMRGLPPPNGPS